MEALVGVLVAAILILVAYVAFTRLGSRSRESVQGLKSEFQTLSQEAFEAGVGAIPHTGGRAVQ